LVIAVVFIGGLLLIKSQNFGTEALWKLSNSGKWIFPLVTAGALIDSINPCAFSVLILTIAFLFSLGRLRSDILRLGSFYILGVFLVYVLIGLGILHAFHFFNTPYFMGKLGSALLIALGLLSVVNALFPSFPIKLKIPQSSHHKMAELIEKASAPAVFLLGAFVGLCEFPCTGGPYLMVLGLLYDKATYWNGLSYLIYYNLVFILPLVILLLLAGNKVVVEKIEAWQKAESKMMRLVGGLIMIVLGSIIFLI
jgi:cytochrome c biogenesis protein CcdA